MSVSSSKSVRAARRVSWAALSAAGFALFAANASAGGIQTLEPAAQTTVRFADLNLASAADTEQLYTRLGSAARSVCSDFRGRELRLRWQRHACIEEALANAVETIDHAALTALHNSKREIRLAQRKAPAATRS